MMVTMTKMIMAVTAAETDPTRVAVGILLLVRGFGTNGASVGLVDGDSTPDAVAVGPLSRPIEDPADAVEFEAGVTPLDRDVAVGLVLEDVVVVDDDDGVAAAGTGLMDTVTEDALDPTVK